jgi:drug/metabolite transporter (DMT)-like permease
LHTADASKSAFFNTLAVIVVPLLDSFFQNKELSKAKLVSIATALAGVALLQFGPALMTSTAGTENAVDLFVPGDVLCFLQAVFFGVGYWRLESASVKYPNQAGRITAGQLLALGVGATGVATVVGLPSLTQLQDWLFNPFVQYSLLWTGLVSTAFCLYLETVALKVVSATELTVLMTSVSLWGSGFAFLTMHEILPPIGMLGGLAILAGCILSTTEKEEAR